MWRSPPLSSELRFWRSYIHVSSQSQSRFMQIATRLLACFSALLNASLSHLMSLGRSKQRSPKLTAAYTCVLCAWQTWIRFCALAARESHNFSTSLIKDQKLCKPALCLFSASDRSENTRASSYGSVLCSTWTRKLPTNPIIWTALRSGRTFETPLRDPVLLQMSAV